MDLAVNFARTGFGECEGGVYVGAFGHVGRNRADGDGRCVGYAAVGDAARCGFNVFFEFFHPSNVHTEGLGVFEDGIVPHFDAQFDGVGGRARTHWNPAVRRYVVPLAIGTFVLQ